MARAALKPSTLYGYHSSLDKHLLPAFGEARLSQITPIGVEKFVQSKMAAGKGAKTLRNQLLLLQSVFSLAEELKVVTDCPVRKKHKPKVKSSAPPAKPSGTVDSRIEKALRAWRLEEARRRGIPAFRILTDNVLRDIAITQPATSNELLAISGIGMSTVEKYGPSIHRIVNKRRG